MICPHCRKVVAIGANDIRAARVRAGLSYGQAAKLAGVDRPNYIAIEMGRRTASTDLACKILDALRKAAR